MNIEIMEYVALTCVPLRTVRLPLRRPRRGAPSEREHGQFRREDATSEDAYRKLEQQADQKAGKAQLRCGTQKRKNEN